MAHRQKFFEAKDIRFLVVLHLCPCALWRFDDNIDRVAVKGWESVNAGSRRAGNITLDCSPLCGHSSPSERCDYS
jgi:hypothetical protein